MDHGQKNMMMTVAQVMGFAYTERWPKNHMLSNLVMMLMLHRKGKFLSILPGGPAIAGGSVVVPLDQVPEALLRGQAAGQPFFTQAHGMFASKFMLAPNLSLQNCNNSAN